jgi:glycosyltransferase involved in cell wall biosynthesis
VKTYSDYEHWKSTPLEGDPYLSIVIPAYNEANRIVPTIGAIAAHLSGKGYTWELIIADDGSKDETVQLVNSLDLVNMRVLKAPKNGGKGSAVRRGVLAARGKYILFDDADNSTPIEEIDRLLPKLEAEGFQMAVGSRAADGAQEGNKSLKRKILSYGLRFIVKHFFRIGVKDTQCGFKLYTREAAQKLHTAQTVMGFSFDLEILYLASKFGMQVAEVPVSWVDAPGSKVDPAKEARRFIKDLLRIRLNDLRGAYHNKRAAELRVAVVGTHPPSQNTLTEYGYHFIRHLRAKPDVSEVILICDELPAGETYQIPGESGLAPVTVVPAWKFGAWNNALRIWKAIRQQKPDVVLFNIQFASFASSKLIAALGLAAPALSRAAGYPTITLLHNIMETVNLKQAGFAGNPVMEALTRTAGKFFTRLLLRSDEVAVTIPKYVEILQKEYKTDKVVLAPHGAFNQTPEPVFDPNPAVLRLMTFGKFGTYKKVEDLVEAFQKLQVRYSQPMELVIAGTDSPNTPGYLAGVQQQYAQVKNLRFTGYVPEEAVAGLFTDSTVVIFPYTSTTGSSGVLHQAGEYGKAVVLPRLGDLAELVTEEGYSGEFFEPGNIDSLVNAISTLLDNAPYREEMGMRNYLAAQGLPMADVVDWYLVNFYYLLAQREQEQQPKNQRPLTITPAAASRTSTRATV